MKELWVEKYRPKTSSDYSDGSYTLTKITKNDDTKLEPGEDPAGSLED